MKLDIGLSSPIDLLAKAAREKERVINASVSLDNPSFPDHIFNFAVTVHHISDWAKKAKPKLIPNKDVNELLSQEKVLQACRDICNSVKHFEITKYAPTTKEVQSIRYSAAGVLPAGAKFTGPMGTITNQTDTKESYEVEGYILEITMNTGEQYNLEEFCDTAISVWRKLFERYGYAT